MIWLALLAMTPDPNSVGLDLFSNEYAAARAFEEQLTCIGGSAFDRRADKRDPKDVAAEVVKACSAGATKLRAVLLDVYRRKPELLLAGQTPDTAAEYFVTKLNGRAEVVIREARQKK